MSKVHECYKPFGITFDSYNKKKKNKPWFGIYRLQSKIALTLWPIAFEFSPIVMSAGELESGNAGEPAKLIRQRYREAADIIRKGKMCCLFINDLDAGAGRLGGTTQYTVNNQMVNATLMNIADNPTNVQLPGMYNKEENPRVPIIVTGNDFSTLYAPLIRDGRMEKFYWAPTRDDRIGVCQGIFRTDGVLKEDIIKLVDTFLGQSIGKAYHNSSFKPKSIEKYFFDP